MNDKIIEELKVDRTLWLVLFEYRYYRFIVFIVKDYHKVLRLQIFSVLSKQAESQIYCSCQYLKR